MSLYFTSHIFFSSLQNENERGLCPSVYDDDDGRQLRHHNLSAFINSGPLRTRCPLLGAHATISSLPPHHGPLDFEKLSL